MQNVLTLHFIDGTKLSIDFPEQANNAAARKIKLDDFLVSRHLIVEAEGSVLVFPVANIKYIAIATPILGSKGKAVTLPRAAILGARVSS
jgi:hypothetical protein